MKRKIRNLLALALCVCLCMNMGITAFAANSLGVTFSATLDRPSIETSNTAQTVVMTVSANQPVTVDGIGFTAIWDPALTLTEITGGSKVGAFDAASTNLANGKAGWTSPDLENVNEVTDLAVITFTVPANTPAGTYNVGVNALELTSDYAEIWENSANVSTTLTITEAGSGATPATGEYNASISSGSSTVTVGDTISVSVNVASDSYPDFNAAEIALSYSNNLTFVEASSSLSEADVNASAGTLKLVDKGESESLGNSVYTLVFRADNNGSASITLTSAAFGTNEEAETEDLNTAVCNTIPLAFTINKASHSVTLPDIFTGETSVEDGADYTFSKETVTGAYYDYGTVTATMGGDPVAVTDNGNGTWTIANVTGALVISGARTAKQYSVTITGDTAANDGTTATYNTDYTFTLPEDLAAGTSAGYTYAVTSVTIGGNAYTGYSATGKVYTIPGTDITGDIVITITKTDLDANQFTVSVTGNGAGDATLSAIVVNKNGSVDLTLNPETGYTYSVTAGDYTPAQDGNVYTVSNITSNVEFVVTKTVNTSEVDVSQYVTLDGTAMWLVKNETAKLDGKVYTYGGNAMFWSEEYEAYCTLVVATEMPSPTAEDFAIITGTATEVNYGKDVNMTGKVDANDAQLVYNIYNTDYSGFTTNVTIEKFLRADVNGDETVNTEDAAAIVSVLLA